MEQEYEYLQKIGTWLYGSMSGDWYPIKCRMTCVGIVGQCLTYVVAKFIGRELKPQEFRIDQEYFPRDEDHTHEWMARRIREM
jgi:hypothetical protein